MNKYFNLANIVLVLFIIFTLGDVVSTIFAANKHSPDMETHPFHVWGMPLWLLLLIKLIIYSVFFLVCTKWYPKSKVYIRYYLILFLVFLVLIQAAVIVNNLQVYNKPKGSIEPLPKDQRIQFYNDNVGDMKIIKTIEPFEMPLIINLLFFNMFVFFVWVSFERKYDMYGVK